MATRERDEKGTRARAVAWMATASLALASACGSDRGAADQYIPTDESQADPRVIEESDLYKIDGDWLYVQNPSTGLNVIDVANPDEPVLVQRLDLPGQAGEIYVRGDRVFIVFESASCSLPPEMASWMITESSEVVAVLSPTTDPRIAGRYCLPGTMVSSRIVGDVLYAVTTYADYYTTRTWVFSVNISDPETIELADYRVLEGQSYEIHVTDAALFIAQQTTSDPVYWSNGTWIRYIDITDPDGVMVERGDISVAGMPQGRFHMDASGSYFRIVTYSGMWSGTNLHVIDIHDPDNLALVGSYSGLAPEEELWATRFDDQKVYIVTYLRETTYPHDPLWVISLNDPTNPTLEGALEVPGWSNYIFPRGDRLIAVGRGDRGARVAVSLYDVSRPDSPAELERVEFGEADSTSEANADFRGIRIHDTGAWADAPMVTVPYTNNISDGWNDSTWTWNCHPENHLQIIDLLPDDLSLRGEIEQEGTVRRAFGMGTKVYSLSDKRLAVLDTTDRDAPYAAVTIDVGDPMAQDQCTWNSFTVDTPVDTFDEPDAFGYLPFGCSVGAVGAGGSAGAMASIVIALLALAGILAGRFFPRRAR